MILFSQAHLSERIKQVPEGVWKATAWLDYPQGDRTDFYACELSLRRVGDRLELDFTASSPQAPAVINCGEPGLISSVLNAVMAMLGYGLPLCPEAVLRTIKITSTPGTFVHATHPAGCSKATTAACMAIRQSINIAVSKMMSEVDGLRSRVLAGSGGYLPVIDMAGTDQRGDRFGVPLLDIALSAGYGAMPGKDGIDSAGTMGAPSSSIANVEVYEARYPILYLWRRHAMDSGGLGEYRGGRGLSLAFTPTASHGPLDVVLHGHGCAVPSTPGLSGGLPGGTNTFAIWRGTGVLDDPSHGLPQSEAEFHGSSAPVPGLHQTILAEGDIVLAYNNGGGGLGDPIAREPRDVLIDVISSAVSVEWAQRGYGVVVRDQQVDEQATHTLRAEMRQRRKEAGTAADVGVDDGQIGVSRGTCPTCRAKPGAWTPLFRSAALQSLGPLVTPHREDQQFRAVEVVCSTCGALLDVSVIEHEDVQVRRHD
jgi:N-methylhydantoinase B